MRAGREEPRAVGNADHVPPPTNVPELITTSYGHSDTGRKLAESEFPGAGGGIVTYFLRGTRERPPATEGPYDTFTIFTEIASQVSRGFGRGLAMRVKCLSRRGSKVLVLAMACLSFSGLAMAQGRRCLLYTSPSPRDGLLSRMPS